LVLATRAQLVPIAGLEVYEVLEKIKLQAAAAAVAAATGKRIKSTLRGYVGF